MVASLMSTPTPSFAFSLWNIPLPQVLSSPLHSSPRPPTLGPRKCGQQLQAVARGLLASDSEAAASLSSFLAFDVAGSRLKLFPAETPTGTRTHILDVWLLG